MGNVEDLKGQLEEKDIQVGELVEQVLITAES
jgi:hypothetical protein